MRNPLRKFIGMLVLVTFVIVYAFVAMVIGDMTLQHASLAVQLLYFGIAGIAWTLPAGAIIWWMEHGFRIRRRRDAD